MGGSPRSVSAVTKILYTSLMQFTHLVITAGISAISERNVLGRRLRGEPGPLNFPARQQNPELKEGMSDADAVQHVGRLATDPEVQVTATKVPTEVSAEFSLIHALRKRDRLHDRPTVVLLHTATLSGRISAAAVSSLLQKVFDASCILREIADFDTKDPDALRRGLGAFMHQVVSELRNVDSSYACFAPQGGYKVMTSLGYVAGSFLNFPTAYLHEDFQALHIIPPIPIALSSAKAAKLGRLARQAEKTPELSKLLPADQEEVLANPWLFEVSGETVFPNAFAQFLGLDTREIFLSPRALKTLSDVHNAHQIRQRLKDLPSLVQVFNNRQGAYTGILDHEREFTNLNRRGNQPAFHIWKASGGDFYIAWRERRSDGSILINRIWGAGHTYDTDAANACPSNSQGLFDDPSLIEWRPLGEDEDAVSTDDAPCAKPDGNKESPTPGSSEMPSLKAKIKELKCVNDASQQNAAKFRKEAALLQVRTGELENQVKNLKMQVASLSQPPHTKS